MNMLWLWGGVAVVTLVAEIATTALVSIWFTIGAVGALIAAAAAASSSFSARALMRSGR